MLSTLYQYLFLVCRFYYITRDVTLNYGRFLYVSILALDQERTSFMLSKLEYSQRKVNIQVQLKPISRGYSSVLVCNFRFL